MPSDIDIRKAVKKAIEEALKKPIKGKSIGEVVEEAVTRAIRMERARLGDDERLRTTPANAAPTVLLKSRPTQASAAVELLDAEVKSKYIN
jgi:hypothetical protein